jgi:hypothetical protein
MSGGQNYLLLAMDMAKVGGCEGLYFHAMYKNSVLVVKVFAEI